jgi:hypothetical protein
MRSCELDCARYAEPHGTGMVKDAAATDDIELAQAIWIAAIARRFLFDAPGTVARKVGTREFLRSCNRLRSKSKESAVAPKPRVANLQSPELRPMPRKCI